MAALQIVWFKRDLRIVDHQPLEAAAERGLVLPLYVVEPELWQQPDASERQWMFCRESLLELRQALADRGQPLVVRAGDVVQCWNGPVVSSASMGCGAMRKPATAGRTSATNALPPGLVGMASPGRNPAVWGDAPDAQPQWLGQTLGGSDDGAHHARAGRVAIAGGH